MKHTRISSKPRPKDTNDQNCFEELVEKFTQQQQVLLKKGQPTIDANKKIERKGLVRTANTATSGTASKTSLGTFHNGSRLISKLVQTDPEKSKTFSICI